MKASTLNRILRNVARVSIFAPVATFYMLHFATSMWMAVLIGVLTAIVSALSFKMITFAALSMGFIGNHTVTCKNCGKVTNPCASPLLIDMLKKMQDECDCSKGV